MKRKSRTEEERKEYNKKYFAWWQQQNREKCRLASVICLRNLRNKVLEKLGGKCVQCGFSDWRALQVDHKNSDGAAERRESKSITQYLKSILKNSDCYQILCANCNWIKRHTHQEFGRPVYATPTEVTKPEAIYKKKRLDKFSDL
jgi:hypothetical protein